MVSSERDRRPRAIAGVASRDGSAITSLWEAFWTSRDREDRNSLVLLYQGIVDAVVARLPSHVRSSTDVEDLQSFGLFGLIEAIDRFDESSPIDLFPGYAQMRIRGAIYDELRRLDWLPRTIRRRVITYRVAVDELSHELGRTPSRSEIRDSLGMDSATENAMLLEIQSAQLTHFNQVEDDGSEDWSSGYRTIDQLVSDADHGPEDKFIAAERIEELRRALAKLPERQRTVITLHLLAGLTQSQVGVILSISSSRVSQIEVAAIESLRSILGMSARASRVSG